MILEVAALHIIPGQDSAFLEWFEFNDRKLQLYPASVDTYRQLYEQTGFLLEMVEETESKYATIMKGKKI
ncbi:hypothetical protein M5X04_18965 [Paenibacillus alvei]|uniref:Uncharacterized protein n=1 Tax=Paenibacillus alvei TaxID=44250 RepID=A0ABT4ECC8_PAEAL|nr:hypothetical protein [Paenibacillus alvei]MCY9531392.1 hypothetical protein [Paenibacillus alvei]